VYSLQLKQVMKKNCLVLIGCLALILCQSRLQAQDYNWHFNSDRGEIWGANKDNIPATGEDFIWVIGLQNWHNGDGTEKMRLSNSGLYVNGRVGIGTASPECKLDVCSGNAGAADIGLNNTNGGRHYALTSRGGGNFEIMDFTANSARMVINPSGNIGIGTTNPNAPLAVKGPGVSGTIRTWPAVDNGESSIAFYQKADGTGPPWLVSQGGWGNTGNLVFGYSGPNYNAPVMTLLQNGKVGIGTTTPSYPLHVTGGIGSNKLMFLSPVTGGDGEFIQNIRQTNADGYGLSFSSGSLPRMTILQNGNVGIGTTNPSKGVLHVKGSFHVENNDGFQLFHVSSTKALVFVGKTAYTKWEAQAGQSNGVMNQNAYSLWVSDGIVSEDYAVAKVSSWSDYVFDKNYPLTSLEKLEQYLQQHKHLPAIPSEEEVKKNGYSLTSLNQGFLKTMEELTLYAIDQDKKNKQLAAQVSSQQAEINTLAAELAALKALVTGIKK
jgi:hypothetical protein